MYGRNEIIDAFTRLGAEMVQGSFSVEGGETAEQAVRENPWFMTGDIHRAAGALAGKILDRESLLEWAAGYGVPANRRKVAVIMAGNIPFSGLFDMMCVLVSGHECLVKYSSKDRVAMEFVAGRLKTYLPDLPLREYEGTGAEAVIASGSDNTIRHLKVEFGDIPAVYRGSRSSAAILDGSECVDDLAGLATDIFSYSGLGCRNVSHILLPEDYDIKRLLALSRGCELNPRYVNNYRQRSALLTLSGENFVDCGNWLLRFDDGFPAYLSEVTYGFYKDPGDAVRWVELHENELQCIVANKSWNRLLPFGCVPFGQAQYPGLSDFPDRVDIMKFLENL